MSSADPAPLVGQRQQSGASGPGYRQQSNLDGVEGQGDDDVAGGGAKPMCIGVSVTILIILALIGGVVAWVVLHHNDPSDKTSTPGPATTEAPKPAEHWTTKCASVEGDNCLKCNDGYDLFDSNRCYYKCDTDLSFDIVKGDKKGICVDDTTLRYCPDNMPVNWPNAVDEPILSLRMFKAWQSNWNDAWQRPKEELWADIGMYLNITNAKVLVGTQITCNKEDDEKDWANVMEMMKIFGPGHIKGLAVGNELELLFQSQNFTDAETGEDHWQECMDMIWTDGYFLETFHRRVKDMDSLGDDYKTIPVTSVFGGAIFAGWPFVEMPVTVPPPFCSNHYTCPNAALVMTFLNNVTSSVEATQWSIGGGFGTRWVWTLNIYPYFDPGNDLDKDPVTDEVLQPPSCNDTLARATCFDPRTRDPPGPHSGPQGDGPESHQDCLFTALVASMRDRMSTENFNSAGARDGTLWIGETGWSFPIAETLETPVKFCPEFSSEEIFQRFYREFLRWDMEMTGTGNDQQPIKGPDHVFWFTMRDSVNFGKTEAFGLVGNGDPQDYCTMTDCKLQDEHFFTTTTPYTGPPTTKLTTTTKAATTIALTTTTIAGTTSAHSSAVTTSAAKTSSRTTSPATMSKTTSAAATTSRAAATTSRAAATTTKTTTAPSLLV